MAKTLNIKDIENAKPGPKKGQLISRIIRIKNSASLSALLKAKTISANI